jgi:hypothetical protein
LHIFNLSLTEPEFLDAIVVELVRGFSFEETLEQIYKIDARRLSISQILIARAPVTTPIAPSLISDLVGGKLKSLPSELDFLGDSPSDFFRMFSRFPDRPIHLLFSHDHSHYLSTNLNPKAQSSPLDDAEDAIHNVISAVRKAEIAAIVEDGRARFGPRHYPVSTVLDHNEYLFGTYSDSLLRACLLRAARDYELVYTDEKAEIEKTKRAMELITSTSPLDNDISPELVVAALSKKFPKLDLSSDLLSRPFFRLGLKEMFGFILESSEPE